MNYNVRTIINLLLISSLLVVLPLVFAAEEGLMLYLPFDGNTEDASGNGNHAEVNGNVSWVDGKSNQAMGFDGATYVEIPDKTDSGFDGVAGLTIEVWVKQSTHHDNGIVVKLTTVGQHWPCGYNLETWSDQMAYFGVGADTGEWAAGGYPLDEWYHLAGVFDGGQESLYINGEHIATISDPSDTVPDSDLPVYVGCVDPDSYPFAGALDELAIYSRALSGAEIQEDMNTGIVATIESKGKVATTWATIRSRR